ncbi:hypothetical protein [Mycoplasma hafezii]|uniref:hypothetical protein n=1 Tax=Mycoplasma hafezii TaxID=525886 RepID=UPI003CED31B3
MADYIIGKCSTCNKVQEYYFGDFELNTEIKFFLEMIKTKQINLFKKEKFMDFYKDYIKNNVKTTEVTPEKIDETLDNLYKEIMNFFSDEEKQLLQKNILMEYQQAVVPVYKTEYFHNPEKGVVYHHQHLYLKFLGGLDYVRDYDNYQIFKANVEEDTMLCPFDGTYTVKKISQND